MEETPMDQSTNAIETVGLLIGAAQSDTIYRDVYLRRARDSGFKDQIPEDRQASLQNRLAVPLFVAILHEVSEISEKSGFCRPLLPIFSIAYDWRSFCTMLRHEVNTKSMFKIQRSAEGKFIVFTLSGRIKAAHLAELQRLFELEAKEQRLRLDLHEVKLVDREAVRFLARCDAAGITLVHCPAYIREWIVRERDQP
jgi:hypothetical protein